MKKQSGFTLIELLVVVAILGPLAAIVIASLNAARTRSADSAVKAAMSNMRTQAEIFYDSNTVAPNAYGNGTTACPPTTGGDTLFGDSIITKQRDQIKSNARSTATETCVIPNNGQGWAYSISALKGGGSWCIDSFGFTGPGLANTTSMKCQ